MNTVKSNAVSSACNLHSLLSCFLPVLSVDKQETVNPSKIKETSSLNNEEHFITVVMKYYAVRNEEKVFKTEK